MTAKTTHYQSFTPQSTNIGGYRYFFNGQEGDSEVFGDGVSLTAEFWQYDSRLGRRWNIDPVFKAYESPFACLGGSPIWFSDPQGNEKLVFVGNDSRSQQLRKASERYYKNDPVIHLWAHGDPYQIYTGDNRTFINNGVEMNAFLSKNSEVYQKNIKDNKVSILVLHACQTGKGQDNIAQQISAELPLLVVAPSEDLHVYTTDPGKPYEYSFEDATFKGYGTVVGSTVQRDIQQKGVWNIYYKGELMESFDGTSKPIFQNPEQTIDKYEKIFQERHQNDTQTE